MAIYAECDGCKRCTQPGFIDDWRTLSVSLGPPPNSKAGMGRIVYELLLCGECGDLLGDFSKLKLAVNSVVFREGGRSGE